MSRRIAGPLLALLALGLLLATSLAPATADGAITVIEVTSDWDATRILGVCLEYSGQVYSCLDSAGPSSGNIPASTNLCTSIVWCIGDVADTISADAEYTLLRRDTVAAIGERPAGW